MRIDSERKGGTKGTGRRSEGAMYRVGTAAMIQPLPAAQRRRTISSNDSKLKASYRVKGDGGGAAQPSNTIRR